MPETLFVQDFSSGWIPSDDSINGRKNGMLQMDNLELDRNGALTLIGGCAVKQAVYPANAHTLFSRFINGIRHDYGALTDGSIYRDSLSIAIGGDTSNAAFSTAFNFTLIASGTVRLKDTGTSTIAQLGVIPPNTAPNILSTDSMVFDAPTAVGPSILSNITSPTGGGTSAVITANNYPSGHARPASIQYLQVTSDPTTGYSVVQTTTGGAGPFNFTSFPDITGGTFGTATDDDAFPFYGYTPNPFGVSLQIDLLLVTPNGFGDQVASYFSYKINDLSTAQFDPATGVFILQLTRSSFTKFGNGDWNSIKGVRITFQGAPGQIVNYLGTYPDPAVGSTLNMFGGSNAMRGVYQFAQCNVNNTGSYQALSPLGPPTNAITLTNTQVALQLQAPTDPQVNEVWVFARSTGGSNSWGMSSFLNGWYRVARRTSAFTSTFYVNVGDIQALTLNIQFNLNLISIAYPSITEKIYDILGPIQGRWFYFTANFMYPSDINNPDLINPSIAVRLTGSSSELFMWARAVSDSVVLVGTSVEVYLLTGTFSTLPDGTIDVYYKPLGVKFPPISYDAASYGGAVYYLASDGWRVVTPTSFGTTYSNQNNQLLVAPNTDRLYRGENCYGYIPPNLRIAPGSVRFPVTITRNKLWCFITGTTGRGEVYDFLRQYWRTFTYNLGDVTAACSTQDGQVLASYASDRKLREVGIQTNKLIDNLTQQNFKILLPVMDNGQARQRKDTYTFKVRCFTGNASIFVTIGNSAGVNTNIPGSINSTSVSTENFLDLSTSVALQLTKTYQVLITGQSNDFILNDVSIDYDPRPVPLTFLKVNNVNYGTTARKRIYTVPFQVDTLGNNILVQCNVDGTGQPNMTCNSTRKQTFDYLFGLNSSYDISFGRDYDWVINGQGSEFEWYGFEDIRNIEVFPDPCSAYVIPKDNFGSPVKKRFRTWPMIINTRGHNVTFTALADGVPAGTSIFNTGQERATVFHYFTTDVFGVDYSGTFSDPTGQLEIWKIQQPDSVETAPLTHRFDQIGPTEFLRLGKIIKMELRVLPTGGTVIPFTLYFSDAVKLTGTFVVADGVDDSYYVDVPKGINGRVLRVELGPTNFDFRRYYMRFLTAPSGGPENTELQWITIPGETLA